LRIADRTHHTRTQGEEALNRNQLLKLQREYELTLQKYPEKFEALETKFHAAQTELEIDECELQRKRLQDSHDELVGKIRRIQTSIDDLELADRLAKQKAADSQEKERKLSLFNSYVKQRPGEQSKLPSCQRCSEPTRIVTSPKQPEMLSGSHWTIPTNNRNHWAEWWISTVCTSCMLCQRVYPDDPNRAEIDKPQRRRKTASLTSGYMVEVG
jgi:hypothetical protein